MASGEGLVSLWENAVWTLPTVGGKNSLSAYGAFVAAWSSFSAKLQNHEKLTGRKNFRQT